MDRGEKRAPRNAAARRSRTRDEAPEGNPLRDQDWQEFSARLRIAGGKIPDGWKRWRAREIERAARIAAGETVPDLGEPLDKEVSRFRRMLRDREGSSRFRGPRNDRQRSPGDDREEDQPYEEADAGPARRWGKVPPAFPGMLSAVERGRLQNARNRCGACRAGKAMEIEHAPCGGRWWLRAGCRTRLCEDCGEKYRAVKRQKWEVLSRLHVAGEESKSSLKFLTLTFPDNMSWESPAECRAFFREWTARLRGFLGPFDKRKKAPCAPVEWGVRGYLAVWEVTAEVVCGECQLPRSAHDRTTGKGRDRGIDKRGNIRRANECAGWRGGARTGRFHPHLHLLVWSNYLPIPWLRSRWESIGGGGQIRLEPAEGEAAVDYVLKYLAKPWAGVPDDLQVAALYRVRRVTSTGEFYGAKFSKLTAALMEPCEKVRHGIYCPACHGGPSMLPGRRETVWYLDGEGRVVSEQRLAIDAVSPAGEVLEDLRKIGRPVLPPSQWRTIRTRLLIERDSEVMEPAHFATFAWNGAAVETLDDKKRRKLLATGKDLHAELAAADPEDDVPF